MFPTRLKLPIQRSGISDRRYSSAIPG